MFKSFLFDLQNILKSKWKLIALILMLLIPLIYASSLVGAFWSPIKNLEKINMQLINNDKNSNFISQKLESEFLKEKNIKIGNSLTYDFHFIKSEKNYTKDELYRQIDAGKFSATFVIPQHYEENIIQFLVANYLSFPSPNSTIKTEIEKIFQKLNILPKEVKLPQMKLFNSYKSNYLLGELTSMIAQSNKIFIDALDFDDNNLSSSSLATSLSNMVKTFFVSHGFTIPTNLLNIFLDATIKWLGFNKLGTNLDNAIHNIIKIENIGNNINTYGKGLSPYFMSMASWAGCLVLAFLFGNHRNKKQKHMGTFANYFGKSLLWVASATIQTILMFSAIYLIGVRWDANPFIVLAYALIVAWVFALTIQAITSLFRYEELGSIIVIILLILQLTSSSGTFPTTLQNPIFNFLHPIVPFTYTINAYREFMHNPNYAIAFGQLWHIIILLLIVPIAFLVNWIFDHKTRKKVGNEFVYKSFEINLHDE